MVHVLTAKCVVRWRAYRLLKPYPPAERAALRLKVCAGTILIKHRREWGCGRKWQGNYLIDVRIFLRTLFVSDSCNAQTF